MTFTLDNISEWVKDLSTKHSIHQYRVHCIVEAHKHTQEYHNQIVEELGLKDRIGSKQVTEVGEELAVVCYTDNQNRIYYIPYAVGKNTYEWFPNFESALVAAICLLKTGSTDAVKYAAKLLEIPL